MRRMTGSRVLLLLLVAGLLAPMSVVLAGDDALQGEENLLENPGLNGEYIAHDSLGDVKVAPGWEPWYIEGSDEDQEEGFGRVASYYWASEDTDPGGTNEGEFAQYWKHTYGTGAAGILQTVSVPNNSKLRLSVWTRTFTCHSESIDDDCIQDDDAWMGVQIAVDPEGGDDFYASSVVFTPGINGTANEWEQLVLEADAPGSDEVTVFFMYHPDFPREQNKVYFDNASLIVIGEAEGEAASSGDGAAAPAPALSAFVTPQPPQADGSIVHTVSAGENLSSIAVAYYNQGYTDVTVITIRELNNLTGDIIYVGQKLTIVAAGGAAGSAPTAEATPEGTPEEEEESTPEPTEVAETTSQVCMSLFDDVNGNTLQDTGELLLAGGTLTLTSSTGFAENYTTDGATEPHCFSDLTPGEYVAAAGPPAGFSMTTVESWSLQVDSGANLDLTFGAFGSGETGAQTVEGGDEEGGGGLFSNIGRVVIGVSGLLVLAVAGGLGAYFLVFRRT